LSRAVCGTALAWLRLNAAAGLGPDRLRELAGRVGLDAAASAPARELGAAGGLSPRHAAALQEALGSFEPERELQAALDLGLRVLAWDEPDFPQALRSVADAPLILYVWGCLEPGRDALAVVGSRTPTPYGRRMARSLAREAASRLVVVSGLARGIDSEAHRAALEAGGTTWAVLGSGLRRLYPPENAALAHEIASSGGCLMSEFLLDAPPLPGHFPRRNRVVAGLSWGTVVVEGRDKSGSLITARLAAEQGREVFAVPGPADSPLSEATFRLISEGAKPVRSFADILPELPPSCRQAAPGARRAEAPAAGPGIFPLAPEHGKILELLGSETRSFEELGRESGLDAAGLTRILFEMELQDLIEPVPGQRYAKKTS